MDDDDKKVKIVIQFGVFGLDEISPNNSIHNPSFEIYIKISNFVMCIILS